MEPLSADTLLQEGFIFSPKELESEVVKQYEFLSKLGEGSFGLVLSAIEIKSGKKVAIKKIKLGKNHEGMPSSALREISILKSIQHENIVK
jgi:serine/threonine protein kinase